MPSYGPNSPSTGADDASVGTVTWTSPTNITAADASNASAAVGATIPADTVVKLVIGGVISGTNKSAGAAWANAAQYDSFGGAADLWGLSPTPADVNGTTFGVVFSATGASQTHYLKATGFGFAVPAGETIAGILVEIKRNYSGIASNRQAVVDHVRITITTGGGGSGAAKSVFRSQVFASPILRGAS